MRFLFWSFVFSILYSQSSQQWLEKAAQSKDPKLVLQYTEKALEEDPKNNYAYFLRGWAYVDLEQYNSALKAFKQGAKFDRPLPKARLWVAAAYVYSLLNMPEQTLYYCNRAIEQMPTLTAAYYYRAWAHFDMENFQQAIQDFQHYLKKEPKDAVALYGLSLCYYKTQQYENALQAIDKALNIEKKDAFIRQKALILFRLGKYAQAHALMQPFFQSTYDQTHPRYFLQMGDFFFNQKDYELAIRYYSKAIALFNEKIERDPQYRYKHKKTLYEAYLYRGHAYYYSGNLQKALADYNRAKVIDGEDYRVWHALGYLQTDLHNWKEAVDAFERSFQLNPKNPDGWVSLGYAYDQLGRKQAAIRAYSRGIERDPDNGLLYNNRGFAYLELKQYDKAFQDLTKAIAVDPDIPMSHISLGEYYIEVGEYEKAIQKFNEALAMENRTARETTVAYYKRAMAYYMQHQYEMAAQDIEKALRVMPNKMPERAEVALFAGKVFFALGHWCKAQQYFLKALEYDRQEVLKRAQEARTYLAKITAHDPTPCD